jgi:WD40 repeat protein
VYIIYQFKTCYWLQWRSCWQVGSADHHIHYFDLRNASMPLYVFKGHRKAVSYVKFISPTELASASTDSTLRLWDVQRDCSVCWTATLHLSHYSWAIPYWINSEYSTGFFGSVLKWKNMLLLLSADANSERTHKWEKLCRANCQQWVHCLRQWIEWSFCVS